jgi:hypothetical protein
MKGFDKEGDYIVKVVDAKYKKLDKEGDPNACQFLLLGETEDGYSAWGDLNWTTSFISQGKNQGRMVCDVSRELLAALGVEDGSPMNLLPAIEAGLRCQFSVKWDEYKGQRRLKVAFINPISKLVDLRDLDWAKAGFGTAAAVPAKPAAAPAKPMPAFTADAQPKTDDIPF